MEITNKNVFITGSTRGIGLAIAHHFAAQGANLVLNGRSEISSELIGEFDQYDVQVVGVSGDVSDADDAKRMIQEATDALGSVDVLINNAGITADKLVLKMTADDFERVLKINLTGAFNMTQAVLKPMTKARQGAIINMTSVVGLIGNAGQANYAASKAGVIGLTKALAKEEGPSGITVNCVAPGVIETDMMASFTAEDKAALAEETPVERLGTPEEVARTLVFLAGRGAGFITGQVLGVNGGIVI